MSFTKVHHIKTFPLPFTSIVADSGVPGPKWIVTPLAEIPWDKMYLYCSEREFDLIPDGSKATKCKVHVQHLTSNTQFETGGSTVQTSTTNNSKILMIAQDLEKGMRGR
eukprot:TRINITY_DN5822_c0_g1_i1.p1 TRINITY_DN5822_c0_g1~~TRINITY_DN5822_c0_g1_i1.p1  ORF type:complete len:109 (+),score=9.45 TRINITY_DN5822_c0_g1_i1:106-432(+)